MKHVFFEFAGAALLLDGDESRQSLQSGWIHRTITLRVISEFSLSDGEKQREIIRPEGDLEVREFVNGLQYHERHVSASAREHDGEAEVRDVCPLEHLANEPPARPFVKKLLGVLDDEHHSPLAGISSCPLTHAPYLISDVLAPSLLLLDVEVGLQLFLGILLHLQSGDLLPELHVDTIQVGDEADGLDNINVRCQAGDGGSQGQGLSRTCLTTYEQCLDASVFEMLQHTGLLSPSLRPAQSKCCSLHETVQHLAEASVLFNGRL